MPMPIGDLGPFTPSHCSVCGEPIPKVDDPSSNVRRYARNLNYMKHLEKYHPEYYRWTKRWTNLLYVPILPFVILGYVSAAAKSPSLLLIAVSVFVAPYVLLLFYKWRKVREFRKTWKRIGMA
jgi:hypothetical protein